MQLFQLNKPHSYDIFNHIKTKYMKRILTLFIAVSLSTSAFYAQCTSGATSYDLTVSGSLVLPPSGPSYSMGIVCSGGHLMDSAMCCTRFIHIEAGGIYEAGPAAYGMVYIKSGGTFDAHGNTMFFGVNYEIGATILNYTGPMTLCSVVTFPPGACTPTEIAETASEAFVSVYPNPCNDILHLENNFSNDAAIAIYDITGKLVMEHSSITNDISVSRLSSGIYTFTIARDGNTISYGKFAIAR